MDTAAEEAFDRIVLRATESCQTPVALISLVADDRQWFKARIGFAPSETPLGQSVCKYALHERGLLVIPDLAADPRTSDNTLVTGEPRIRFYAGAKIEAADGTPIGSLCVIDTEPRPEGLTPVQAAALEGLAVDCSAMIAKRAAPAALGLSRPA